MPDRVDAYIGVGSNVGDRASFVRRAVEVLGDGEGVTVEETSSLYETTPVGGPPQRSFVNAVIRISCTVEARELLGMCAAIENRMGRDRDQPRWGPRVIDLDILTFGSEKISEPDLEIPHPRISQRRFVLIPLLELDPEAADPWGSRYGDHVDEAEGDVTLLEAF
jgi:2-amino-4-hydroxy-6-hydroxymethyldihydropteridine diphosphokinase